MKMDETNASTTPIPQRPKLTISPAWPRESHHAPSVRPVEPHYRTQEPEDLSPRTTYPSRPETLSHQGLDIDPAVQVPFSPHAPFQRHQQTLAQLYMDGADFTSDVPLSPSGSRMMAGESGESQRLDMDGQYASAGSRASMGTISPDDQMELRRFLTALGGVDGLAKFDGLVKKLSLEQQAAANRGATMNPTPLESPRDSFQNLSNPMPSGMYPSPPSPPSSVVAGSVCSKTSSVRGSGSPRFEATTPTSYSFSPGLPKSPPLSGARSRQFSARSSNERQAPNTRSPRSSSSPEETDMSVVEKAWGQLYDSDRCPTEKMGRVLKGIASHITGLGPGDCVVVTPSDLRSFYNTYRLRKERHPYREVFVCEEENETDYQILSTLFDDVGCDYHLVKPITDSRPMMPALTPTGFIQWFHIAISAYPNDEAQRLDKVCKTGSIDIYGPEGKSRLPAELPRRLLPDKNDASARKIVGDAINKVLAAKARRHRPVVSQPIPPPPPPSPARHSSHNLKRQGSTRTDSHIRASEPNVHRPREREREREPERNDRGEDDHRVDRDRRRKSVSFGKSYPKSSSSRVELPRHNSEGSSVRPSKPHHASEPSSSKAGPKESSSPSSSLPSGRSQSRNRRSSISILGDFVRDSLYTLSSAKDGAAGGSSSSSSSDELASGRESGPRRERRGGRGGGGGGRDRDTDYHGHYSYGSGSFISTPRQGPEAEVDRTSTRRRSSRSRGSVKVVDPRRSSRNLGDHNDGQSDY